MSVDFTLYDDEALDALRVAVLTEQERRHIVATAQAQIAALQDAYERATMQEAARNHVTEQLN